MVQAALANEPQTSQPNRPLGDAAPTNQVVAGESNPAQAAALRGINWLVAHKDTMPLGFALKTFEKIHRVTADASVRQRMAKLIHEKSKALPAETPRIDPENPDLRDWYTLRPHVNNLIYVRALGKPWKTEAENLARLFAQHGDAILPSRWTLSERLVAAYKLQILGVPTGEIYASTLAEIRAQEPTVQALGGGRDMMNLYARTHIAFTASGYYQRYLNPTDYAPEVACFARAVAELAKWEKLDDSWADLASEILIARKLLRQPVDAPAEALARKLTAQQNPDGSWGQGHFSVGKVHHTAVTVLALIEFAPEFQICLDYM